MEQPIRLDKDTKVPIHQQLYSYIKERIVEGFYKENETCLLSTSGARDAGTGQEIRALHRSDLSLLEPAKRVSAAAQVG